MRMQRKEQEAHLILEKHLPYYVNLSLADKVEFRKRVRYFIRDMKFRGGKKFAISFEHIVAVAGSAIQVSFGNEKYILDTFHEIIIYEKVYQNPMTHNYHRGEVNPAAGIIVVSWDDFVYGYTTDEDNLNVGLHEMAHAYYFEIMKHREDYKNDYDLLSKFMFVSEYEIMKIRKNRSSLFRDYAGENVFEFFAVAVEYFFEDGPEFRKKLPNLYRQMCLLLNQDTADGIARGFDFNRYFERIQIEKILPTKSTLLMEDFSLKMKLQINYGMLSKFIYTLVFITFITFATGEMIVFEALVFLLSCIAIILIYIKFSLKVYTTDTHLYLTYSNLSGKKTLGIPLNGIVSVSMQKESKGDYLINYNENGQRRHIKVSTSDRKAMHSFERLLIKNNIMTKMDGMRMARIKSHKTTT